MDKINCFQSFRNRKLIAAWLLVLPVLLIRLATTAYPMLSIFYYSLTNYSYQDNTKDFVGLSNFKYILTDIKIKVSIEFTIVYTIITVLILLVGGITLGLILNTSFSLRKYVRTLSLIPWALPMILTGIAAKWAFNDTYGLINDLVRRILPSFHFDWLVEPMGAKAAIILVDVWKNVSFFAILVLAGLQSIPEELYESARIDGAGALRILFNIKLPHIKRTLIIVTMFFTFWRLSTFDLVYALTRGGPGMTTSLLPYRVFMEAFMNLNIGYGSAIAVIIFIMMAVIGVIGFAFYRRVDY